jgi:hypothetical protein
MPPAIHILHGCGCISGMHPAGLTGVWHTWQTSLDTLLKNYQNNGLHDLVCGAEAVRQLDTLRVVGGSSRMQRRLVSGVTFI